MPSVYPVSNFYFWTDSSIILCWINNTKTVCKPYVQHRLIRIHELVNVQNFLLVPLKMNSADIATLSLAPLQLVGNTFWRDEPEFLTLPGTSWSQLQVSNIFKSFNISGISNNGTVSISSNINNTVNKNVQFSIYTALHLLEDIAVSHNLVISEISSNTTTDLLSFCNSVFFSNAIVKNIPDKTNVVITGEEMIQANNN